MTRPPPAATAAHACLHAAHRSLCCWPAACCAAARACPGWPAQLREELSNARGINDLTADETTKLLLDNSRLQQAALAARSEALHKEEMLRLLSAEVK